MHKMLMKNIDTRVGYKQFPNEIIGSQIELTLPEKVHDEMNALIEIYEKNRKSIHYNCRHYSTGT